LKFLSSGNRPIFKRKLSRQAAPNKACGRLGSVQAVREAA